MNLEQSESQLTESSLDENTQSAYEAPAIESVLTPESLEREVHYAGIVVGSGQAAA